MEWMAYKNIHPLTMEDSIAKALIGSQDKSSTPAQPHWMQQKMNMLNWFSHFGKEKKGKK